MAKRNYLLSLFNNHLADLKSIRPDVGDFFVCPICLRCFSKEYIDLGILTDGHIWPKDLRKISKKANDQTVLLCKQCNGFSGSKGDFQMQLHERIASYEKDSNGELYGLRTVEVIENPGEKPIRIQAKVNMEQDSSFTLSGLLDGNNNWVGSSPEDQARFLDLTKRSMLSKLNVHVTINKLNDYKPKLVSIGWITSGSLGVAVMKPYLGVRERRSGNPRDRGKSVGKGASS